MVWNASDYGGLTKVHVGSHEVWQPDVMLYNSATATNIDFGNTNVIVKNNGSILWVPPFDLRTFCSLDMRLWPFDTQICPIILGSWTHDANTIDLTSNDEVQTEIEEYVLNHQWKLINVTKKKNVKVYSCCEEPYVDISYSLKIQRKSPIFNAVVITPATIIILMTLANFWLPAQAGEKILLNGINAIIIVIFLIYFAQKLPLMSFHIPLIGK